MLKKRNAQGLSINVIVAAVIALIILLVLVAMLTGKFGDFSRGVGSLGNPAQLCSEQGGILEQGECPSGKTQIASKDSIAKGNKCCK